MRVSGWSRPATWRIDFLTLGVAALLLLAAVFGGGGAEAPLRSGWLEAGGALLLTACAATHFASKPLSTEAAVPVWLVAATLALIAFQLVPLPPAIWTSLPGRQNAITVAELIGGGSNWRPLSLDPEATRRTASALLLPVAILIATLQTRHRGLLVISRAIVLGALLSALFGAYQIATGAQENLYGQPFPGIASGFFANPNHQAEFMLLGLVATGLLIRVEQPQIRIRRWQGDLRFHLGWLLFPIFAVMTVATQSRAGSILLVPALVASTVIAVNRRGAIRLFAVLVAAALGGLAIYAMIPGSVASTMRLQSALMGDGRIISLPDILYTLGQYWPWGSGFGTFIPVFQANENLDLVLAARLNHAHNDYLEILVEAGLPGAVLIGLAALALGWRLWRLIRRTVRTTDPGPALAGFSMLALLLIHSLVDYPARMASIAAVAAAALGLCFSPAQKDDTPPAPRPSRRRRQKGFASPVAGRSFEGATPWR